MHPMMYSHVDTFQTDTLGEGWNTLGDHFDKEILIFFFLHYVHKSFITSARFTQDMSMHSLTHYGHFHINIITVMKVKS